MTFILAWDTSVSCTQKHIAARPTRDLDPRDLGRREGARQHTVEFLPCCGKAIFCSSFSSFRRQPRTEGKINLSAVGLFCP